MLDRVYDVETGLVRFVAEVPMQPEEPALHLAVAEYQNPFLVPPRSFDLDGREAPETTMMGTGAALDRLSALWSTVGEAIERYALHVYDRDEVTMGTPDTLDLPCVAPDRMILFADHQYAAPTFRFVQYDPSAPIGWVRGIDLAAGSPAYLPAALSYLGYRATSRAECLDSGYSTGAAAGPNLAAAYHSGLLETIERDGFACHWYLRRPPPELDVTQYLPELPPRLVDIFRTASLRLRFFDLTTDLGVPTVLAIGLPTGGGAAIGAAARPSFAAALEKAAIEAFHTLNWVTELKRDGHHIEDAADVRQYRDHVIWHLVPERLKSLDFLLHAERPARLPAASWAGESDADRLAALVARLKVRGYESYGLDMTPAELEGLDLNVVRSFVPGLHPLGSGTGIEHADDRRLRQFANAVGWPFPGQINFDPHPFP
ncbi:YcaO-like family protein [Sphingomonas qomolangmaensis]|uniref:YcaO-like family protein n=1 Tax=Sphingomonas qomolangmaensis TaxID=2918765 RepID=A0ABY5LCS3_9SPHN|nr:YcaO-like family protein [Sphingomonas qomolangmaensis]UUL82501.1 YcaO-like family protein [Sphingomonas qomolangmaensis]